MSMFYNVYSVDEAGQKLVFHGTSEDDAKFVAQRCPAGAKVYVVVFINGLASGFVTQRETVLCPSGGKARPYFVN